MRNIVEYIFEQLSKSQHYSSLKEVMNSVYPYFCFLLSNSFNKYVGEDNLKQLKQNTDLDVVLLKFDLSSKKLLDELETTASVKYYSPSVALNIEDQTAIDKFGLDVFKDRGGVVGIWLLNLANKNELLLNGQFDMGRSIESSKTQVKLSICNCFDFRDDKKNSEFITMILFYPELKDKAVKWFKSLNVNDINNDYTEFESEVAKAVANKKPHRSTDISKPIRKSLVNLYNEVVDNSEGTLSDFEDISKKLKDDYEIDLKKKDFEDIFGDYAGYQYSYCKLSNNGYEGDVEKAFSKTWGPEGASSYMDVLKGYVEIDEDNYASFGKDKNGIFIVIFECEPCLVLMTWPQRK